MLLWKARLYHLHGRELSQGMSTWAQEPGIGDPQNHFVNCKIQMFLFTPAGTVWL